MVAAAFGVVSLPAIVYQPPNCAEREKVRDDCRWVQARPLPCTLPQAPAVEAPGLHRTQLLRSPSWVETLNPPMTLTSVPSLMLTLTVFCSDCHADHPIIPLASALV